MTNPTPTLDRSDLEALWLPFTANRQFKARPRLLAKASGMHYWTADGRQILDAVAGLWCVNAGHGRREITQAVASSLETLDFAPTFQMAHPPAFRLANELAKIAPSGLDHVFFTNSGSESVDTALKYAFVGRRRKKRDFRRLWVVRINAAARMHGLTYGQFISGLKNAGVTLDRKSLSEIAISSPAAFATLAKQAKAAGLQFRSHGRSFG